MRTILSWAIAAIIVFSTVTFTGCKKEIPTNNNQWVAETLTFKVNNSSDEFIMKRVEGGDYSMEYMYDDQVKTVTETLSDFYICPVEVTNKLWDDVMGWRLEGQLNNGESYTCTSAYHGREIEHNGRNATVGFRIVLR